jgi:hypothetical protein
MVERIVGLKRAWSAPRLVSYESLVVLSQSFLGMTTAGVQFDLMLLPGCSRSQQRPGKCQ